METLQPGGTPGTRSDMSVLTCEYALMAAVYAEPTTCSRRSHKSPAGHCPAGLLSDPAPLRPCHSACSTSTPPRFAATTAVAPAIVESHAVTKPAGAGNAVTPSSSIQPDSARVTRCHVPSGACTPSPTMSADHRIAPITSVPAVRARCARPARRTPRRSRRVARAGAWRPPCRTGTSGARSAVAPWGRRARRAACARCRRASGARSRPRPAPARVAGPPRGRADMRAARALRVGRPPPARVRSPATSRTRRTAMAAPCRPPVLAPQSCAPRSAPRPSSPSHLPSRLDHRAQCLLGARDGALCDPDDARVLCPDLPCGRLPGRVAHRSLPCTPEHPRHA